MPETPEDKSSEEAPEATPEDSAPKDESTPKAPEEVTPESSESPSSVDKDAEIAELRRKLDEAAPIIQAHADAEEQNKSELQKSNERAESLEAELTKLRDEAARARVAERTGLPSDVVALLNGATEEQILKAAEKVARAKPQLHTRPSPAIGSGPSKGDEDTGPVDPRKLAEAIRKRMPY